MVDEKVIDKIRKVLALTKSNYQEEAHAALLKAQELMAEYGLSMAEVESCQEKTQEKQVVDTCIHKKKRTAWYEKRLGAIIAENFRCYVYIGLGAGVYFIGLKEDVEIAREVYLYALNTMLYLAGNYVKKYGLTRNLKGLKNDYIQGFLTGLHQKFKKQVQEKCYALVLVKDALVVQAMENKRLKKGRPSKYVRKGSKAAWSAGYEDGRSFDENRKVIEERA